MSEPRITRMGKELLLDGAHLADARDDKAAEAIRIALDHVAEHTLTVCDFLEPAENQAIWELFA